MQRLFEILIEHGYGFALYDFTCPSLYGNDLKVASIYAVDDRGVRHVLGAIRDVSRLPDAALHARIALRASA